MKASKSDMNIRVVSGLIGTLLITQLAGCFASFGSKAAPSPSALPDWVQSPPSDDVAYVYGIGEGRDLESSKQSALKDIAGKLATYVQSKTENRDYLFNGRGESSFKQKVNTEIKKIKLSSVEVLKTQQGDQLTYVLSALPRAQFVSDKQREIQELNAQIEVELKQVEGKNKLVQLQRYSAANALAEQAKPLMALVTAADRQQDYADQLTRYRNLDAKESTLLETSKIFVEPNVSLPEVVHQLTGILQSHGLQIGNSENADGIFTVSGNISEAEVFSSDTVKMDLNLALYTPEGQSLSRTQYLLTGSSVTSFAAARQNALQELNSQLANRKQVYALFGVK